MIHFFNYFVKFTGFLPQLLVFRTKVRYENRSRQSRRIRGAAIIACNHTDVMDYAAMLFTFFFRTIRCQVAELQFERPLMRIFLKLLGAIRVDRSFNDIRCMQQSEKLLQRGAVVGIFPEGRLPLKGETPPLPFKSGAVHLALSTGVPIVPVYTNGKYFSRQRAEVIIGEPMDVRALYDSSLSERENLQRITGLLQSKIYGLPEAVRKAEAQKPRKRFWWKVAYDFVKITAAIPGLIWLRPKWVSVDSRSRRIRGRALVVSNHNRFYDPISLMVALFYRRFRFVATQELFEGKFKNWLFYRVFRCIPIDRTNLNMQTLREVNEALKNDELVALFPEGHVLSGDRNGMGSLNSGMVLMAAQGKSPLVPVYMMPPKKLYNRLRIAIGAPIEVNARGPMPTMDEIARITGEIEESMEQLRIACINSLKHNNL